MAGAGPLYRCVCGCDIPLGMNDSVVCPECGRRHRGCSEHNPAVAETAAFPRAGGVPAARDGNGKGGECDDPCFNLSGQTLDHFEVLEELGRGGMGTVYRALDHSLERYVALKVINCDEVIKNPDTVKNFVHEARAQARISHPGIATIYYVGRLQEMPYFAMEYIPGANLGDRLKGGRLPFREVVELGIQAVEALQEANDRGVVHRDIKPGNMILTRSGRVKLTDFGLSKTDRGGLDLTGSNSITGTPFYIAPEQARGESTDFRTDIYSLGATLYHLAYGRPPFEGDGFMAVISRHLAEPVSFPRHPPAEIHPGFPRVLERMMAKEPAARFRSYTELREALLELRPEAMAVPSVLRRGVAALLDYAACILGFLVIIGTSFFLQGTAREAPSGWGFTLFAELSFAGPFAVLIGFQIIARRTPGKLFGRLRIASIDGGPLERWRAGARALFQFLPPVAASAVSVAEIAWNIPLGLGTGLRAAALLFFAADHLWVFTNRNRRALHDLGLGTWVLEDR